LVDKDTGTDIFEFMSPLTHLDPMLHRREEELYSTSRRHPSNLPADDPLEVVPGTPGLDAGHRQDLAAFGLELAKLAGTPTKRFAEVYQLPPTPKQ
jgi:hypothetical protein